MHFIKSDDGKEQVEVWFARELQTVLGYARWENFQVATGRAVESCKSQNVNMDDHFREVTKMVVLGSGAKRDGHVTLHLLVESASGLIYVKRNAFKRNLCTFVSDYHHQAVDP